MLIVVFIDPDSKTRHYMALQDVPGDYGELRSRIHRQLYLDHTFTKITHYFHFLNGQQCSQAESTIDRAITWTDDYVMSFVRCNSLAVLYFYEISFGDQESDSALDTDYE